jgi:hypothetical protein
MSTDPDLGGSPMRGRSRRVEHPAARILAQTERPVEAYSATLQPDRAGAEPLAAIRARAGG